MNRGGRGHYDGDGANHASISVAKAQAALQKARAEYQRMISEGMDSETARRAALLGIRDAKSGAPAAVAGGGVKAGSIMGAYEFKGAGAATRDAAASGDAAKAWIEHAAQAKAAVQDAVEAKSAAGGGKGDFSYTKGDTIHNNTCNLPHTCATTLASSMSSLAPRGEASGPERRAFHIPRRGRSRHRGGRRPARPEFWPLHR